MKRAPIHRGIEAIELAGWQEFYGFVADRFSDSPAYVFRGQADASWKTFSSLDRWEQAHAASPVNRELHLRRFRQAVRSTAPIDLSQKDDGPAWALAQHHGLRTPLLDWSLSPFVALYFAFEDEFVLEDRQLIEPEGRAVLALSTSVISRAGDRQDDRAAMFPRVYSPSGPVSQRLLAQSSIFLEMPAGVDLETFVARHLPRESDDAGGQSRTVLLKIMMPGDGRLDCLRMLNKMNINRMTLFPDLDGAARYINDLWDVDPSNTLGYFEDLDYAGTKRPKRRRGTRKQRTGDRTQGTSDK
jgi:hypothetical protein